MGQSLATSRSLDLKGLLGGAKLLLMEQIKAIQRQLPWCSCIFGLVSKPGEEQSVSRGGGAASA